MRLIIPALFTLGMMGCLPEAPTKPITVHVTGAETKFETNDSSFFKIKLNDENYEVSLLNKDLTIENNNALDKFLEKNKDLINIDKVLVTGIKNMEKFENCKDLLSKYGITKFRVNRE